MISTFQTATIRSQNYSFKYTVFFTNGILMRLNVQEIDEFRAANDLKGRLLAQ